MRLYEFSAVEKNSIEATVIGVLNFLRNRAHNYKIPLEIDTDELIAMVQRTGVPFSYEGLIKLNDEREAIRNLISTISRDKVEIRGFGDEDEEGEQDKIVNPEKGKKGKPQPGMGKQFPSPQPAGGPNVGQQPGQELVQPLGPGQGRGQQINQVQQMAKRAMSRRR